jgi:hypothetical protein
VRLRNSDRNDAVHTAYSFRLLERAPYGVIPHTTNEAKRIQRMKDKNLLDEFRVYRDELNLLRIFAIQLYTAVQGVIGDPKETYPSQKTLPERHLLRSSVPSWTHPE